jgi:hypothetical protein
LADAVTKLVWRDRQYVKVEFVAPVREATQVVPRRYGEVPSKLIRQYRNGQLIMLTHLPQRLFQSKLPTRSVIN